MQWKRRDTHFAIIAISIIVLDQLTKFLVSRAPLGTTTPIFGNFLTITHHQNTGAAFSILQNQNVLLMGITVIVLLAAFWYYPRIAKNQMLYVALIVGGAMGNLVDRLLHGYVIDFIAFSFWPAFNVADATITIGAVLLIWKMLKKEEF